MERTEVQDVTIQGNNITGTLTNRAAISAPMRPMMPSLVPTLARAQRRTIKAMPRRRRRVSLFWGIVISWFPMLLLIGVWIFFMRQMQSGGGKAMGFGKSRAKLLTGKARAG